MPAISIFFGIVVRMFYNDHGPPHFHAEYQGQRGKFDSKGRMVVGSIQSKTALRLIKQWAEDPIEGHGEGAEARILAHRKRAVDQLSVADQVGAPGRSAQHPTRGHGEATIASSSRRSRMR